MRVLNLFGGPGIGKSTTRAKLFGLLKSEGLRVEEAPEFAKDLTYEKNWPALANQLFVTAGQEFRLDRVNGQVDWCISDSPLPLGMLYVTPGSRFDGPAYRDFLWHLFDSYDNVNIMLRRVKPYQQYGRSQSEEEARELDDRLRRLMAGRIHFEVDGGASAHRDIYARLMA